MGQDKAPRGNEFLPSAGPGTHRPLEVSRSPPLSPEDTQFLLAVVLLYFQAVGKKARPPKTRPRESGFYCHLAWEGQVQTSLLEAGFPGSTRGGRLESLGSEVMGFHSLRHAVTLGLSWTKMDTEHSDSGWLLETPWGVFSLRHNVPEHRVVARPGPALVSAANTVAFPAIRAAALVLSHQLRTGDGIEFEIQLSSPSGPSLPNSEETGPQSALSPTGSENVSLAGLQLPCSWVLRSS